MGVIHMLEIVKNIFQSIDFSIDDVKTIHLVSVYNNVGTVEAMCTQLIDTADIVYAIDGAVEEQASQSKGVSSTDGTIDILNKLIKKHNNFSFTEAIDPCPTSFIKINNVIQNAMEDNVVIVSLEHEYYKSRDIETLKQLVAEYPTNKEFFPNVLNFWRSPDVIRKPSQEWTPQAQRVFRYSNGIHYDVNGFLSSAQNKHLLMDKHYHIMASAVPDLLLYKYDFAAGKDFIFNKRPKYKPSILTEYKENTEDNNTLLCFDGTHPIGVRELYNTVSLTTEGVKLWNQDEYYQLGDNTPNCWAQEPSLDQDTWIINSLNLKDIKHDF